MLQPSMSRTILAFDIRWLGQILKTFPFSEEELEKAEIYYILEVFFNIIADWILLRITLCV